MTAQMTTADYRRLQFEAMSGTEWEDAIIAEQASTDHSRAGEE